MDFIRKVEIVFQSMATAKFKTVEFSIRLAQTAETAAEARTAAAGLLLLNSRNSRGGARPICTIRKKVQNLKTHGDRPREFSRIAKHPFVKVPRNSQGGGAQPNGYSGAGKRNPKRFGGDHRNSGWTKTQGRNATYLRMNSRKIGKRSNLFNCSVKLN